MSDENTVASRIKAITGDLTRAERQLANSILENYPVSALGSITLLSARSGVSNPTIARMVKKIGFSGFPQMQAALRSEVDATISNPITRHERLAGRFPDEHLINLFAQATMENLHLSLDKIDPVEFDALVELLSDMDRHIRIVGGRITHPIADYLHTHLQMIRDRSTIIPPNSNTWPHYVLAMKPSDILIIFDIRRYEREITNLAASAHDKDIEIVLLTDQWGSPIAKFADHIFRLHIEIPSASDSNMMILFIVEAIIAAVQNKTWPTTEPRMNQLESMFDRSKLFSKFT